MQVSAFMMISSMVKAGQIKAYAVFFGQFSPLSHFVPVKSLDSIVIRDLFLG